MNLAFLASHRGSNMQSVLDACRTGRLRARPCVVISNNRESEALARAQTAGILWYHLSRTTHPVPEALDAAILDALQRHTSDLIILAGYLWKLDPKTLTSYRARVIKVHLALLPKYGGQGMYGLHVHEAVLSAGDQETGVTIHVVDEQYDHGPIIAQRRVPVLAGDTAATLAQRILDQEHRLLVETLEQITTGRLVMPR